MRLDPNLDVQSDVSASTAAEHMHTEMVRVCLLIENLVMPPS
jgi:hypothetical protein